MMDNATKATAGSPIEPTYAFAAREPIYIPAIAPISKDAQSTVLAIKNVGPRIGHIIIRNIGYEKQTPQYTDITDR